MPVEFVGMPERGRRYRMSRPVYLGDVDGNDEMHLEALGRFLQDVATDDAYDSGLRELGGVWVVRRYDMRLTHWPAFRDVLDLVTFCGRKRTLDRPMKVGRAPACLFLETAALLRHALLDFVFNFLA